MSGKIVRLSGAETEELERRAQGTGRSAVDELHALLSTAMGIAGAARERPPMVRLRREAHEVVKARAARDDCSYPEALHAIVVARVVPSAPGKRPPLPAPPKPALPKLRGLPRETVARLVEWMRENRKRFDSHPRWSSAFTVATDEQHAELSAAWRRIDLEDDDERG